MALWYYINESGNRQGPVTPETLKSLVKTGGIRKSTVLVNQQGRQFIAGQIKSLDFPSEEELRKLAQNNIAQSSPQPIPTPQPAVAPDLPSFEDTPQPKPRNRVSKLLLLIFPILLLLALGTWQGIRVIRVKSALKDFTDKYGKDLQRKDPDTGLTLLHYAATEENIRVIKQLLKEGISINDQENTQKKTPLHMAAACNKVEIVEFLIQNGGDVKKKDAEGQTPLHSAATSNPYPDVLNLLINSGSNISERDNNENTPLHLAVQNNDNISITEALLEKGADPNAIDRTGASPLHVASVKRENLDIVRVLLDHGANVNHRNNEGNTPLYYALGDKNTSTLIELYIRRGANIENENAHHQTPLHLAAIRCHQKNLLETLLENGADPNCKDDKGKTPLDCAKEVKNQIAIDLLTPVTGIKEKPTTQAPILPQKPETMAEPATPLELTTPVEPVDTRNKSVEPKTVPILSSSWNTLTKYSSKQDCIEAVLSKITDEKDRNFVREWLFDNPYVSLSYQDVEKNISIVSTSSNDLGFRITLHSSSLQYAKAYFLLDQKIRASRILFSDDNNPDVLLHLSKEASYYYYYYDDDIHKTIIVVDLFGLVSEDNDKYKNFRSIITNTGGWSYNIVGTKKITQKFFSDDAKFESICFTLLAILAQHYKGD